MSEPPSVVYQLIYCPAAFEVGQAEFTSLCFFVISLPRLQPRWGPSPSTTGYRKYLSLIAPGHWPWTSFPKVNVWNVALIFQNPSAYTYMHWQTLKNTMWFHNPWCVKISVGLASAMFSLSDLFSTWKHKPILVMCLAVALFWQQAFWQQQQSLLLVPKSYFTLFTFFMFQYWLLVTKWKRFELKHCKGLWNLL